MADFIIGKAVETTVPTIEVTVNMEKPLSVGKHIFRLVVVDDGGNQSIPSDALVVVKDAKNPTAVLTAPPQAEPGTSFFLDGTRSSDVPPGKVVRYIWTMLE